MKCCRTVRREEFFGSDVYGYDDILLILSLDSHSLRISLEEMIFVDYVRCHGVSVAILKQYSRMNPSDCRRKTYPQLNLLVTVTC